MRNLFQTNQRHLLSRLVLGMLALALIGMGQYAQAQSTAVFSINENPNVLRASLDFERGLISQADYDQALMDASCMNPAARLFARNQPYVMIRNTSTVADTITSILIDMNEPGFEFGMGDILADGLNGLLALLSNRSDPGVQITSASYGNDNTQLRINFSGLAQGQAAIFKFDIDEPGGSDYPDFRQAIQGVDVGNGPGELATLTTTFANAGTTPEFAFQRQPGLLRNPGHAESYHAQTMLVPPPVTIVPEPTSAVLLLSGATAVFAARRRRR